MLPPIPVQRKYLLLLNRQYRKLLKIELIPTPSTISEEDVQKYFEMHLMPKGNYFIPKTNKVLQADENAFAMLAPKPPKVKADKPAKVPKAEKPAKALKAEKPAKSPNAEKVPKAEKVSKKSKVAASMPTSIIPAPPATGSAEEATLVAKRAEIDMLKRDANQQAKKYMMTELKDLRKKQNLDTLNDAKAQYEYYRNKLTALGVTIPPVDSLKKEKAPRKKAATKPKAESGMMM